MVSSISEVIEVVSSTSGVAVVELGGAIEGVEGDVVSSCTEVGVTILGSGGCRMSKNCCNFSSSETEF